MQSELETLQAAHETAGLNLLKAVRKVFPMGATVIVDYGDGRKMPAEVIGHGCYWDCPGELRVMPLRGKRSRRSVRGVNWHYVTLAEGGAA